MKRVSRHFLYNCFELLRIRREISRSSLFDREFYLRNYLDVAQSCMDPVDHFVRFGWKEGRNPSAEFHTQWYLQAYPDVKEAGVNPLFHFIRFGAVEGRSPSAISSPPGENGVSRNPFQRAVAHQDWQYRSEAQTYTTKIESLGRQPCFSILMPVYNPDPAFFREAIESVLAQVYPNWQLCIADDCSEDTRIRDLIRDYAERDSRVCFSLRSVRGHISAASNDCIVLSRGDYLTILDHDDLLSPGALYEFAVRINQTEADFVYADEDKLDSRGQRVHPFFKPDWSPDLLRMSNYVCHPVAIRKEVVLEAGGFHEGFEGSQDHDLFLRVSEITDKIEHIPLILYSWRMHEQSTSSNPDSKSYAHENGRRAVLDHARRVFGDRVRLDEEAGLFRHNLRYGIREEVLASIIIPTRDALDHLRPCVDSIYEKSTYRNYEILVANNNSVEAKTFEWLEQMKERHSNFRVVDVPGSFNWSKVNNLAVSQARGEVFVFLNNDTRVISEDWLERFIEQALRSEVGAVGALLLFPNDTIQHAGIVVGMGGWADHVWSGARPDAALHYYTPPSLKRNVLAVTGACLGISKETFVHLGGFNESFEVCGSDVELCLRAHEQGLWNIYDPFIRLYHYESATRDPRKIPAGDFVESKKAYERYLREGDPFYNPNLDLSKRIPAYKTPGGEMKDGVLPLAEIAGMSTYSQEEIEQFNHRLCIQETLPVNVCRSPYSQIRRINLLIPTIDIDLIYGGIATSLQFFDRLRQLAGEEVKFRILVTDRQVTHSNCRAFREMFPQFRAFRQVSHKGEDHGTDEIVEICNRLNTSLSVAPGDVFIATAWWTAVMANDIVRKQARMHEQPACPMIYLIQDYEPGFYPWSSRYALAESTYTFEEPVTAVFNSHSLQDYFHWHGHRFYREYAFPPILNVCLRQYLEGQTHFRKTRKILIYGRPNTPRNCIEIIAAGLRHWVQMQEEPEQWQILSAGEPHPNISLGRNTVIQSVGKLSLESYSQLLAEAFAGISLMLSPHPSYPPLEMAHFGVQVITNNFGSKDLSGFHPNLRALRTLQPERLASELSSVTMGFGPSEERVVEVPPVAEGYLSSHIPDAFLIDILDLYGYARTPVSGPSSCQQTTLFEIQ